MVTINTTPVATMQSDWCVVMECTGHPLTLHRCRMLEPSHTAPAALDGAALGGTALDGTALTSSTYRTHGAPPASPTV